MSRPRRLYINSKGKYYYIVNGKKKYIKIPEGMSQKQVQTINIKNIIGGPVRRLKKRTGKRVQPKYDKKLVKGEDMQKTAIKTEGGLPTYIFTPQRKFLSLGDIATKSDDTSDKQLVNLLEKSVPVLMEGFKRLGLPPPEEKSDLTKNVEKYMKTIAEQRKALEGAKSATTTLKEIVDNISESEQLPPSESEQLPPPIRFTGKPPVEPSVASSLEGSEAVTASALKRSRGRKPGTKVEEGYALRKPDEIVKVLLELENKGKKIQNITIGEVREQYKGTKTITSDMLKKAKDKIKQQRKATPVSSIAGVSETKEGFGDESGDDGLYNDQIETIMKKRIKNFVPVVASDQVNSLLNHVQKGDKFFAAVVNTEPSESSGRHWRCIVIDNRDDFTSAEYFDPLAEKAQPEQPLLDVMRKIAKRMNPEKYFKYKFNKLQRQNFNKSNCGYHCMRFIEDRYNGVPFSEATGWDSYMKRQKGTGAPDDSQDGEGDLKSYQKMIEKKFSSYL